jgi:pilus assembly protein FimV
MKLPEVVTAPVASQGNTYTVVRGDNLWKIARSLQTAGSQISLPELMADIHALNPQAFVGGDINRLISGATLLLPDRANPASSPSASSPQPENIAATPEPVPVPDVPEEVAEVRQRLDEALASQDQQSLQLQQQMNDLQSQLAALRELVASKDQQVATLQAQLQQQPQPQPVSASVPVLVPVSADTAHSAWYSSWLSGFAGGGLLAAILGGIFWWRRREGPEPESERVFADYQREQPPLAVPLVRSNIAVQPETRVEPAAEPVAAAKPKSVERKSAEVTEPDALDGANIYIAYGRLDEAREVLERSLQQEPRRNDVRLRLLELLARMGDSAAFDTHEQLLLANAGDQALLERIKIAYPDCAETQSGTDLLDEAVLQLDETSGSAPAQMDSTLDDARLNLDSMELDDNWGLASPFAPEVTENSAQDKLDEPVSGKLELPEVMDIPVDAGAQVFSPFANFHIKSKPADELLNSDAVDAVPAEKRSGGGSLDHLAGDPQSISRLNMALAYIDQGDLQSACNILNQLITEGDDKQKKQAREILSRIA